MDFQYTGIHYHPFTLLAFLNGSNHTPDILKPAMEVDGNSFSFSKQLILGESRSFSRDSRVFPRFSRRRSLVALQLLRQDPRGRKVARSAAEKIQVESAREAGISAIRVDHLITSKGKGTIIIVTSKEILIINHIIS